MDNKRRNNPDERYKRTDSRDNNSTKTKYRRDDNQSSEHGGGYSSQSRGNGVRRVSGANSGRRSSDVSNTKKRTVPLTPAERRKMFERSKRKQQLRKQRRRAALVLISAAVAVCILVFMTPVFNIRQISLNGNSTVTKDVIEDKIGYLVGENLFLSSRREIRNKMCEIPQIEEVEVVKHIYPSSIDLIITESTPAAYLLSENRQVVINSDLKVIDDSGSFSVDRMPSISGISVEKYELNTVIQTDSDEKEEIIGIMLKTFESLGIVPDVKYISVDDLSDIRFNYKNSLEVKCGSIVELERKIRMFYASINSESMQTLPTGVMDFSVPGKGVLQRQN